MNEMTVTLVISIGRDSRQAIVDVPRSSAECLREIVERALRNSSRGFLPSGYGVSLDGRWLPQHLTLAQAIPDLDRREKVYLTVGKLPGRTVAEAPPLAPEDLFEEETAAPQEGIRVGPAEDLLLSHPPRPAAPAETEAIDLGASPPPTPAEKLESGVNLELPPPKNSATAVKPDFERMPPMTNDKDYDLVGEVDSGNEVLVEHLELEEALPPPALTMPTTASERPPTRVDRHATVRYYSQMNPQHVYPLLVVLSKKELQEACRKHVRQTSSGPLRVDSRASLEIEPILPGFACHPHREPLEVTDEETVTVTFFVVPQVLGRVEGARLLLRQEGRVLTRLPLDIRVVNTTFALALGLATLVLPFGSSLLRHFRLDFESQLQDGFVSYGGLLRWLIQSLSPEVLALGLLAGTGGAYLWLRPRRRDVTWDLGDSNAEPTSAGAIVGAVR